MPPIDVSGSNCPDLANIGQHLIVQGGEMVDFLKKEKPAHKGSGTCATDHW